ncbi:MAG: epoxyqueuosine reductase [Candidatus Bathyarchaeota archaeon]|nr:MAG: epoxyqueuosine reductase [Candidatus Bathyarchaeota archaeon]
MNLTRTQDLKRKALSVGFISSGVSNPETLRGLPHGWVKDVCNLRSPEEELPNVNSVILLAYYAWDKAFNLQVDSTYFLDRDRTTPKVPLEHYQLYYEVLKNKAWMIVEHLQKNGFEARLSLSIPLKTAAVKCGLGCQGKNTLLLTPTWGPNVRLISVLTSADLDVDEPYTTDLCGECEKCIAACPTHALEPYKITINRCLTYAAEKQDARDVPQEVRELEGKLIHKPTPNSYIECSTCIEACPIGRRRREP